MPMGSRAAAIRPWQSPNAVTLNTARAQTAYLQGNGRKLVQGHGMLRGAMGRLELSELTVFRNFIDSSSGELLSDSRVRIPFAGLENPPGQGGPTPSAKGHKQTSVTRLQMVRYRA